MIRLFSHTETDFTHNGIHVLDDIVIGDTCILTNGINEIYSLELSSSDELATYDFVADEILVDFSITKAIYFEIKLLKNGEYTGTSTLDAEISDVTFGVFSTPIYNSLYVKLKKVGEFSLIIYDSKYNISRTINVIVR